MSKMLEAILEVQNMNEAYKRVRANKGTSGVDGVTIEELDDYSRKYKEKRIQTSAC